MSELIQRRQEDQKNRILGYLRMGATRKDAAAAAGIAYNTLRVWMHENDAFRSLVLQAEGECGAMMAATIARAAYQGDWRAAQAWLQARRRQEWGKRLDVSDLSDDQIISILESEDGGGSSETTTDTTVPIEGDSLGTVPGTADGGNEL